MDEASVFQRIPESGGVRQQLYDAVLQSRARANSRDEAGAAKTDVDGVTRAWVFSGPPGSGRTIAAKAFAAALLCTSKETPGCGRCNGCLEANDEIHGDLKVARTEGSQFYIDSVKSEIITWAYRRPTVAAWRILIVEDADRFQDDSSNAMLKTVEEPPERTIIIFCVPTVDSKDFSVTLRSRCRHIYIPSPTISEVEGYLRKDKALESHRLTDDQYKWAASVSNGHVGRARHFAISKDSRDWRGRALDLVEGVFSPERSYIAARELADEAKRIAKVQLEPKDAEELEKLEVSLGIGGKGKGVQAATRGSVGQIKSLEKRQKQRRDRVEIDMLDLALMDMTGMFRDALMRSLGAACVPIHPDRERTATELSRRVSSEQLLRSIDVIGDVRRNLWPGVQTGVRISGLVGSLQVACGVGAR